MTADPYERALSEELGKIAPDIAAEDIDRGGDLREEFDIDSIDFLRLVTALGGRFGLEMPEADYPLLATFDGILAYLHAQEGHAGPAGQPDRPG